MSKPTNRNNETETVAQWITSLWTEINEGPLGWGSCRAFRVVATSEHTDNYERVFLENIHTGAQIRITIEDEALPGKMKPGLE